MVIWPTPSDQRDDIAETTPPPRPPPVPRCHPVPLPIFLHLLHIVEAPAGLHGEQHHLVPPRRDGLAGRVGGNPRDPLRFEGIQLQAPPVGLFSRTPVLVDEVEDVRHLKGAALEGETAVER